MPAILNIASPEKKVLDANTVYLQTYQNRHDTAFLLLSNYTFPGGGPMLDYNWTASSGNNFNFKQSAGSFEMDSTAFGAMTADQKKIFFHYLSRFIYECIKNYNLNYNL